MALSIHSERGKAPMAEPPIDPTKPLIARLVRMWPVQDPKTGEAHVMQFVFHIYQGPSVEARMMLEFYKKLPKIFVEGMVYEFQNFIVERWRDRRNKTVPNGFVLHLTDRTSYKLHLHPALQIPFDCFDFQNFESIGRATVGETKLVDIIGRLTKIGPVKTTQTSGVSGRTQAIYLVNERDFCVEVVVREPNLQSIPLVALAEKSIKGPVIIAFNFLEVNDHGELGTCYATRIYFNQKCATIANSLASLRGKFNCVNTDLAEEQMKQSIIENAQPLRVTLEKLLFYNGYSCSGRQFQFIARIADIKNPDSLFCGLCPHCQKAIKDFAELELKCDNCNTSLPSTISSYSLALEVSDSTASTQLWAFGDTAAHIVGNPADVVRFEQKSIPDLLPLGIEALLEKTVLFAVQFALHEKSVIFKVVRAEVVPPPVSF